MHLSIVQLRDLFHTITFILDGYILVFFTKNILG